MYLTNNTRSNKDDVCVRIYKQATQRNGTLCPLLCQLSK